LKALLVQHEAVHEEIIPSLCFYLGRLGFSYEVVTSLQSVRSKGDFFSHPKVGMSLHTSFRDFSKRPEWNQLADIAKSDDYDLIVACTFQFNSVRWFNRLRKPLLAVVHNTKLFFANPECIESILSHQDPKKTPTRFLFLGRHVMIDFLDRAWALFKVDLRHFVTWAPACIMNGDSFQSAETLTRTEIAITGRVDKRNRDFDLLFSGARMLADSGASNVAFRILGGGPSLQDLVDKLSIEGLDEYILYDQDSLARGFSTYKSYFTALEQCAAVLVLTEKNASKYHHIKITSSVMTALYSLRPPIVEFVTAAVYGLPSIEYSSTLGYVLHRLSSDPAHIPKMAKHLEKYRDGLIQRSVTRLRSLLKVPILV
jgi:hypothetical protein